MDDQSVFHFFQEHYIAEKEFKMMRKKNPSAQNIEIPRPDALGVFSTCFAFGILIYMTSIRETIATAMVMDLYALTQDVATFYVSIALSVAGFVSIFLFLSTTKIKAVMDERQAMILLGFLPIVIGVFAHMPIGDRDIQPFNCSLITTDSTTTIYPTTPANSYVAPLRFQYDLFDAPLAGDNDTDVLCVGCDYDLQPWCETQYGIPPWQLVLSYGITILGYPIAMALSQSTYSKVLGPRPQGLWMGILTGAGSIARVTGPVWISTVYQNYGVIVTYSILGVLQTIALFGLVLSYNHIGPMNLAAPQSKV